MAPRRLVVSAKTASYSIVDGDSGKVFTTRGATGAVTFTLPAQTAVTSGFYVDIVVLAAQNVTVATATADTLATFNDLTADSIAWVTAGQQIAQAVRVIADGTGWICLHMPAPAADGLSVGAYTITTA